MTKSIEAVEAAKRDRRRLRVGCGQSRICPVPSALTDLDPDAFRPEPTVVVTTVLRTRRRGRGLALLNSPRSPHVSPNPIPRRRNQTSRTEQADLRAALRLHILRSLASGHYASEADAARRLGVSRAWVGKVLPNNTFRRARSMLASRRRTL